MKIKKIFNKALWCLLAGFFAVWFLIAVIGENYALKYSSTINNLLNIDPNVTIGETNPEKAFKTEFTTTDEKGNEVYDSLAMRANSEAVSEKVAAEGSVLLWNNNDALPLAASSRVSVFGIGSVVYKFSGGGSGEIDSVPDDNLKSELEVPVKDGGAGFKVNGTLFNAYANLRKDYGSTNYQGELTKDSDYNGKNGWLDKRYREFEVREVPWAKLDSVMPNGIEKTLVDGKNTKGFGDAAIMIITRDGAEDGDTYFKTTECLDGSYLDLSNEEADVLTNLKRLKSAGTIKKIIVVLNTASTLQMKNLVNYDVDACLLVGCGGLESFTAIADVLSGKVNPSGRLVDTVVYDTDSIPAMANFGDFRWTASKNLPASNIGAYNNFYLVYQEGVYVGYRYFETRYEDLVMKKGSASSEKGTVLSGGSWNYSKEVAYPFGYGLSYTSFSQKLLSVDYDAFEENYTIKVEVTNDGSKSGRTPVQIYIQKPYTDYDKQNGIEKPSVELAGFTKTGEITAGGGKQTVEIVVPASEFKVYDTYGKGTYILEKGDYYLSVGSDSHDALNNILALKGYGSKDGMVDSLGKAASGNKTNAKKITVDKNDYEKYSKSIHTAAVVKNQISDADINLYEGTKDQKITYLTRNDWDKTYPTPVSLSCLNETMIKDMQYEDYSVPASEGEVPTMGKVTIDESFFNDVELAEGQEKRLTLAMMVGKKYDDPVWENLLDQLTWLDMNYLLSGGYLTVQGAPNVGSPGGKAADGTSGVRVDNPTTGDLMGFPTATVMAQTWDAALIELLGDAFGHECMHAGVSELYAPCANMHRTPYGGRNWEYYSEDPFITGKMLAAETKGLQKRGVIVCAKHFAFNDQELNRCGVATFINEQTAREIYLKGFELGVTEGKAKSLMSSFPRLGCKWEGHYQGLMTGILREEWGFTGFVETDSAFDQPYMTKPLARIEGVICGVDFWMDGARNEQFAGYQNNATVVKAIREACHRLLYAQTNSLIINGLTTSSIVVYQTPWWETAIRAAQIIFGVITAVFLGMAVASFVIGYLDKKKEVQGVNEN